MPNSRQGVIVVPSRKHWDTDRWRSLDARESSVLRAIMLHADRRGQGSRPGLGVLQAITRLDRRTVWRAVQRLEQKGAVTVKRTPNRANRYGLEMWT